MRTLKKYIVKNSFENYLPSKSDFEIVEEVIPELKKDEFLVKAEYISVDPYMRSFAHHQEVPYPQFGFQVGKVVETKNKNFPIDTYVVSHSGWCNYVVLDGSPDTLFEMKPYQPPVGSLPLSLSLGAIGMPGMTAYLGLLEVCKPKNKEIVCVTGAAGAVGSLVGQIAKLKGCTVIGFAGTDQKVQILKTELGFDYAFNYKTESKIKENLATIAPKGIDCFFDNVGGSLSATIIDNMSDVGRVAICGSISTYGLKTQPPRARRKSNVEEEAISFTQWTWQEQYAAIKQLKDWIEKRNIIAKESVTNGFEHLPDAFIGMLKGENIGKAVVKV